MSIQARPWLDQIDPYRPGQRTTNPVGALASNESALGVSDAVVAAVSSAAGAIHEYPSPLADELRDVLAVEHDVHPDQILVGNGSDELIYLLARAYAAHGGSVVCADPAYRVDEISAQIVDAEVVKVPLSEWRHDLATMAEVAADIAYVVNPHNPTGTVHELAAIEQFVADARSRLTVVDEAYIDFVDDPESMTAMHLAREGRAAVLRTFSKVHGLAGARIGYLVASADIVATLRKIRAPFSVSTLAQVAALAAVRHPEHRDRVRAYTRQARAELVDLLSSAGYSVVPSQANFVLVEAPAEDELVSALAARGVAVRPGSALGVPGTVRISTPNPAGMQLFRESLPRVSAAVHI